MDEQATGTEGTATFEDGGGGAGEAARVLERLDRIDELERRRAPARELLGELRELVHEAEAWAQIESHRRSQSAVVRIERVDAGSAAVGGGAGSTAEVAVAAAEAPATASSAGGGASSVPEAAASAVGASRGSGNNRGGTKE